MTRRAMLAGLLGVGLALAMVGCEDEQPRPDTKYRHTPLRWLQGATDPTMPPGKRIMSAHTFSSFTAEDLRPIREEIEEALKIQTDPELRRFLQMALDKAK